MIKKDSEFTDLTKAEVEALLECFDFLRNGYVQVINYNVAGVWIIKMKHGRNGAILSINILKSSYVIFKNDKSALVKFLSFNKFKNHVGAPIIVCGLFFNINLPKFAGLNSGI